MERATQDDDKRIIAAADRVIKTARLLARAMGLDHRSKYRRNMRRFYEIALMEMYGAIVADHTAYDDDDEDVHESLGDLNKLVGDAESPSHRDWREVISELKQAWRMLGWEEARHGVQANSSNSNSRRVNQVPTSWDGLYR
ncbi:MAG: hypothetical protein Q9223_003488 [Gallowayella weberi]